MKELFSQRLDILKKHYGCSQGYFNDLTIKMQTKCVSKNWFKNDFSTCCRAIKAYLEGDLTAAKREFYLEWSDGKHLNREEHYWNSARFLSGDRWIGSAMMAQLLILFDWLVSANAFSEKEIDEIAKTAVTNVESHFETHLKGRGQYPILHEPINQAAAMSCGLLYVGYLFGTKWRQLSAAKRMFERGKQLFADNLGQFPQCGYDGDGFTYMRVIFISVNTLSVALLEDIEKTDWYNRQFAPNNISLAYINSRQQNFITPSNYSWPLGRYGYVRFWNLFQQCFASLKTKDPSYIIRAKFDNVHADYSTLWLGMELPFALLWYPHELNSAITKSLNTSTVCLNEVSTGAWSTFSELDNRWVAVLNYIKGKAPNFFMEAKNIPIILSEIGSWEGVNGIHPGKYDYDYKGWYTQAGKELTTLYSSDCKLSLVDTSKSYPEDVEVADAKRLYVQLEPNLALLVELYEDRRNAAPINQLLTWQGAKVSGKNAIAIANEHVKLHLKSLHDWEITDGMKNGVCLTKHDDVKKVIETERLVQTGDSLGANKFATLMTFNPDCEIRDEHYGVSVVSAIDEYKVGFFADESLADFRSDALVTVISNRRKVFSKVTEIYTQNGSHRLFKSDVAVNLIFDHESLYIENLGYGNFAVFNSDEAMLTIHSGNGLELYGCANSKFKVQIAGEWLSVILNEQSVSNGSSSILLPQANYDENLELKQLAESTNSAGLIAELNKVRQNFNLGAIPVVKTLLNWNLAIPLRPAMPRRTESTNVRLEAVRTLMAFQASECVAELIELFKWEQNHAYAKDDKIEEKIGVVNNPCHRIWANHFWGSSTRAVTLEALRVLDGGVKAISPEIDKLRAIETVPHVQDALNILKR